MYMERAVVKSNCPSVEFSRLKLTHTRLGMSVFIPEPMAYHGPYVQAQKYGLKTDPERGEGGGGGGG